MLSATFRSFLNRIFTVMVAILTMGGSLGLIAAAPADLGATTPKLLATWKTHSAATLSSPTSNYAPTGLVACLTYGSEMIWDNALPFPDRLTNPAVVGCDRVLTPGNTYVIDYSTANDAKFQEFATLFTNATDDMRWIYVGQVNDSLVPAGVGTGGGGCESVFGRHKVKTCSVRNLLTGYTIDFIRMSASNIVSTVSADGKNVAFSVDLVWQAYGHR